MVNHGISTPAATLAYDLRATKMATGKAKLFTPRHCSARSEAWIALWQRPVRFYVPAYTCPLEHLEKLGAELTRNQTIFPTGPALGAIKGVTLLPADAAAAAEFIVLTIEAERKDKIKVVNFTLNFGPADLWMVPFRGDWPLLK